MKQTAAKLFLAFACFVLSVECNMWHESFYTIDQIDRLTRQFEIAVTSGASKAQLEVILAESKKLTANISNVQYDFREAATRKSNFEESAFKRRLQMELQLVAINARARQLKAVQLEILGLTSGTVAQVAHYQFTDSLALTINYLSGSLEVSFDKLIQIDDLLEEARKKHQNDTTHIGGTVLDAATKTKVVKLLKDFETLLVKVKVEIVAKYYSVVEAMRLKGEELQLGTHYELETGIDSINTALHYAAETSALIEKYATAGPKLANFLL